jgi:UDP-N-acetylmuramoylalanine--D-glutamate ligase
MGHWSNRGWSPRIALLTNLAPNHFDWHGDMEHYARCKCNIFASQRPHTTEPNCRRDWQIYSEIAWNSMRDLEGIQLLRERSAIGRLTPQLMLPSKHSGPLFPKIESINLPGWHNLQNAVFAIQVSAIAISDEMQRFQSPTYSDRIGYVPPSSQSNSYSLIKSLGVFLKDFTGLPHRLQYVGESEGDCGDIHAFNDSKCTSPEAASLAVQAFIDDERFGARRVHLIAGGYDKGVDLAPLVQGGALCKAVYTIGATGPRIAAAVTKQGGRAVECEVLDRAVEAAVEAAAPGDVILLSPGCASWDQFTNYEERGERFTQLVRARLSLEPAPRSLFEMPGEV